MPRIVLTARPINAPQASRLGGRRTLRDKTGPGTVAGLAAGLGTSPRPFPSIRWILFWIVVAAAISTRVFP